MLTSVAVQQHVAAAGTQQAVEMFGERRLSGAVLADERDELAGGDTQRDAAQRRGAGVVGELDGLGLRRMGSGLGPDGR